MLAQEAQQLPRPRPPDQRKGPVAAGGHQDDVHAPQQAAGTRVPHTPHAKYVVQSVTGGEGHRAINQLKYVWSRGMGWHPKRPEQQCPCFRHYERGQ